MSEIASEERAPLFSQPPLPVFSRCALLLDVDGTLLEFRDDPEDVRADPALVRLLSRIRIRLGGALALVSGRPLSDLDRMFRPMRFCASGTHGAELRIGDEHWSTEAPTLPDAARSALRRLAGLHPDWRLEEKPHGIALHYRRAPATGAYCRRQMERVAAHLGDTFRVQTGHCVVEITPTDHDKGRAIGALMQHPIFAGREALYLGDDACDEAGFEAVNALGGVSVRVGHDPLTTSARYRLPDPRAVRRWLQALAGQRNG